MSNATSMAPLPHDCQWEPLWEAPAAEGSAVWPVVICRRCGMAKLALTPTVSEAYPPSYYGSASKKFLPGFESLSHVPPVLTRQAEHLAETLARSHGRTPRVLDVGCGRGYYLKRKLRAGWFCAGIDIPGSPLPEGGDGLDCRSGDASQLPWADDSFDLVVINHVLEHVSNPALACSEASRVLSKGGVLYVGVPNFGSWQRRMFGRNWFPLEIPRHLHHFTPQTLSILVSSAGFQLKDFSTWSLPQGIFGFIQSALNAIDPSGRNAFLSLIKGQVAAPWTKLFPHTVGACVLLPLAFIETIASSFFKQGPIVAILAFKQGR